MRPILRSVSVLFELQDFCFPYLNSLHLTLDCPALFAQLAGLSYQDHVRNIPKIMLRLKTHSLSTLWLSFNVENVRPNPEAFLGQMRDIETSMQSQIRSFHPHLRTLIFDVGSLHEMVPWWTAELNTIFTFVYDLHANAEIRVLARQFECVHSATSLSQPT